MVSANYLKTMSGQLNGAVCVCMVHCNGSVFSFMSGMNENMELLC